eukprot:5815780-Prorocentrum_lima.AAC.1
MSVPYKGAMSRGVQWCSIGHLVENRTETQLNWVVSKRGCLQPGTRSHWVENSGMRPQPGTRSHLVVIRSLS